MVKDELHALWHNKLLMVVLLAIMLIPAMYAGFFLSSMWDPYGDLSYLPVAVVNKDKPYTYKDKELTVGDNLADNLKENDSMAFHVVDEETAKEGLESGVYYMVITIPEDFSKCASSLMDNPQKMVLDFETNPGKNYISMKLSESAMKEIRANLTEEITHTYAETVFDSLKDVEDGFGDAVDGTSQLLDGEDKLKEGNDKITDNLVILSNGATTLNASMGDLTGGAGTLSKGIDDYTNGVVDLNKGLSTIKDGSSKLKTGAGQVSDGVGKLAGGLNSLTSSVSKNMKEQTKNQKKYKEIVEEDKKGVTTAMTSYATSVATSSAAVAATDAAGIAATVAAGEAGSVAANAAANSAGTAAAGAAVQTVLDKTGEVIPGAPEAFVKSYGMEAIASMDANTLLATYTEFLGGMLSNLSKDPSTMQDVTNAVSGAVEKAVSEDEITAAVTQKMQSEETQKKITLGVTNKMQSEETQKKIKKAVADVDVKPVTTAVSKLANDAGTLGGSTGALTVLNTIEEQTDLSQLPTLVKGAKELAKGADTLDEGINQAKSGSETLNGYSNQLKSGADALNTGTRKVSDAVGKIADGSGQLKNGAVELGNGLKSLKEGTGTLHDGLLDGKEEIRENEANDETLDMFAAPVEIHETKISEVENNGHGMAAYMFSVGLWVGCLAFCLMYPLSKHSGNLTNGRDWWASKAVVLYPLSILMVVFLLVIMHFVVGFHPGSMFETFVMALAAVACFMSIMYFFNLLLGKVGSFLMLLFMVLQLAGSAGTYPIEISGSFAQALHKWMPFTYSVDGFRAAIADGGQSIWSYAFVLFGISVVFTLMTILVFRIRTKLTKEKKPFLYDWLEEKGLA